MTTTSRHRKFFYLGGHGMKALKSVVYQGEDNGILRNGMPYKVIGVTQSEDGKTVYGLKGVEGKLFDSELFRNSEIKRRDAYIAILKSENPPRIGECVENLSRLNDEGTWEVVPKTDVIQKLQLINGQVFAIYTKTCMYVTHYFPDIHDLPEEAESQL